MPAKWATVYIDSGPELARLFFSKAMGKSATSLDSIRGVSNYPEVTERLNMVFRQLKVLRNRGTEVVMTSHDDIQKVYARGGMIAGKGQTQQEPIAVKGWPDFPGSRTPDELCRAADNVLRVRQLNGKPIFVGKREPLGGGGDYWEVKDRFNAPSINGGLLPFNYQELAALAQKQVPNLWAAPYLWLIYGSFGIGKTRLSLTFPRPLLFIDTDLGTKSIEADVRQIQAKEGEDAFKIISFNVEDTNEYPRFMSTLATIL